MGCRFCIVEAVTWVRFMFVLNRPAAWPSTTGSCLGHISLMTLKAVRMHLFHGITVHNHTQGTVITSLHERVCWATTHQWDIVINLNTFWCCKATKTNNITPLTPQTLRTRYSCHYFNICAFHSVSAGMEERLLLSCLPATLYTRTTSTTRSTQPPRTDPESWPR